MTPMAAIAIRTVSEGSADTLRPDAAPVLLLFKN